MNPMEYGDPFLEWNEANDHADEPERPEYGYFGERAPELVIPAAGGYLAGIAELVPTSNPTPPRILINGVDGRQLVALVLDDDGTMRAEYDPEDLDEAARVFWEAMATAWRGVGL